MRVVCSEAFGNWVKPTILLPIGITFPKEGFDGSVEKTTGPRRAALGRHNAVSWFLSAALTTLCMLS